MGLAAYQLMLGLYAAAAALSGRGTPALWITLASSAIAGVILALLGYVRGWQGRRSLLMVWPVASLAATVLTGVIEPDVTRVLPGTITLTFAYVGLTCPRWRSLALVPLAVVAFLIGGGKQLPGDTLTVVVTAIMWILVAEVPAWLITRLTAQSELLRHVARTDSLTQLLNRSTLAHELTLHDGTFALVLVDLDGFKQYNDAHGHQAGDQLLVSFAETLVGSIRPLDRAFRIGGDEFLLMLPGADHNRAQAVVTEIQRQWNDTGSPVTFSAGIAAGEENPLRIADERMYCDKRSRRPGETSRPSL